MASYEYHLYSVTWGHGDATAPIQKELNKLGAQGWELVSVMRDESPADVHEEEVALFVFKRMKSSKK